MVCNVRQVIMRTLLGYIGKEKHADSLAEKLMLRFEAASDATQWRNLAFCLTQVCPLQMLSMTENAVCQFLFRGISWRGVWEFKSVSKAH